MASSSSRTDALKNCNYCGIRRENDKTERFDMNREDIIKMAQWAYDHEYGSITLQSGERCDDVFVDYVVDLIRDIKAIGDGSLWHWMCVGEQSEEAYRRMREAGASRYLLRIETTNKELYPKFILKMNYIPLKLELNVYAVCVV